MNTALIQQVQAQNYYTQTSVNSLVSSTETLLSRGDMNVEQIIENLHQIEQAYRKDVPDIRKDVSEQKAILERLVNMVQSMQASSQKTIAPKSLVDCENVCLSNDNSWLMLARADEEARLADKVRIAQKLKITVKEMKDLLQERVNNEADKAADRLSKRSLKENIIPQVNESGHMYNAAECVQERARRKFEESEKAHRKAQCDNNGTIHSFIGEVAFDCEENEYYERPDENGKSIKRRFGWKPLYPCNAKLYPCHKKYEFSRVGEEEAAKHKYCGWRECWLRQPTKEEILRDCGSSGWDR